MDDWALAGFGICLVGTLLTLGAYVIVGLFWINEAWALTDRFRVPTFSSLVLMLLFMAGMVVFGAVGMVEAR